MHACMQAGYASMYARHGPASVKHVRSARTSAARRRSAPIGATTSSLRTRSCTSSTAPTSGAWRSARSSPVGRPPTSIRIPLRAMGWGIWIAMSWVTASSTGCVGSPASWAKSCHFGCIAAACGGARHRVRICLVAWACLIGRPQCLACFKPLWQNQNKPFSSDLVAGPMTCGGRAVGHLRGQGVHKAARLVGMFGVHNVLAALQHGPTDRLRGGDVEACKKSLQELV